MGHKRDKVHSFLTSAQKHRSAINQLRKKAAVQGKTEREARRKADAEGEKALLDAERVEIDEAMLESLKKADEYEKRKIVRQNNREIVKEVLEAMEKTSLAEVD